MPPSESGGGVEDQGGNCLGMVRMCGHWPERARAVVWVAALRREEIWTGSRSEGMWM